MIASLDHSAEWPTGYGKQIEQSVDSTLDEARRRLSEIAHPHWILAHEQTRARGRRGRAWSMPQGNFAATLILPLDEPAAQFAQRSFIAALAVYGALAHFVPDAELSLKWPNDVLFNGGKIAGILLESAVSPQGSARLLIGIGVNLAAAPDLHGEKTDFPPVSLKQQAQIEVPPEAFLTILAAQFARYEDQLRSYGFAPIRQLWLRNVARLGEPIHARLTSHVETGIFRDIDSDGQLILETANGMLAIPAADVYF